MTTEASGISQQQLHAALAGDRQAISKLTEAYLPRVYGLCLRMCRNRQLAEEATQDCFVRALKALDQLQKPERFRSWLLMIAANSCKDLLKKEKRKPVNIALLLEERPEEEKDHGQQEVQQKQQSALEKALSRLKEKERELFLLHSIEGVELASLAKGERLTVSAMKSKMHRIRSKVRVSAHQIMAQEKLS